MGGEAAWQLGSFTPPHLVSPAAVARQLSRLLPQHLLLLLLRSFPSSAPSPFVGNCSFSSRFCHFWVPDNYWVSRYCVDVGKICSGDSRRKKKMDALVTYRIIGDRLRGQHCVNRWCAPNCSWHPPLLAPTPLAPSYICTAVLTCAGVVNKENFEGPINTLKWAP